MAGAAPPSSPPPSWQRILRSLHHRNFRLFFIGQGISLIGTWMQSMAMTWLVYQIAAKDIKAFAMGVVNFASQIPSFLLVPIVGVFVDRWNRHRLVITTQALAMVQAFLLAALVLAHVIAFWHLILLSVFMGCINAFDMPGRQAFIPEMLENKEDLANAIALNSSLFNGARLLGPALAGFLIDLVGEAMCFLANALSFIAVLIALLAMRIPPRHRYVHRSHVLQGIKEGFTYAFGFAPIRAIILLIAMLSFVGFPYTVLMPIFADKVLEGNALTLGWLMTASGVGALVGAVYMAWRPSVLGLGSRIVLACLLFGVSLIIFSQSTDLWLSLVVLALMGLGLIITMAGCNTILQTIVEEDKRGRVMSLYTMAFMGMAPFGSLLAGGLADMIGAPTTLLMCGLAVVATALVFAHRLSSLRALIRPIYREKGILPSEAPDLEPGPIVDMAGELVEEKPSLPGEPGVDAPGS